MKHWLAAIWRVLRTLSGDDAYERYLRAHEHHCSHARLSRRDFYAAREQEKWSRLHRCC